MPLDGTTALSALRAAQRSLDVVAQNVANANTPGYTRQRAELQSVSGTDGPLRSQIGRGVQAVEVSRAADRLVEGRLNTARADAGEAGVLAAQLREAEGVFGGPDTGIGVALSDFFATAQTLSARPDDVAARETFLARAEVLAADFRGVAGSLGEQRASLRLGVEDTVDQVNRAASEIVQLNDEIRAAKISGRNANELLDRRDQLAGELSQLAGVSTNEQRDGTMTVRMGSFALVTGSSARPLTTDGSGGLLDAASGSSVAATGGKLAGYREADAALGGLGERLDDMARGVRDAVNGVLATGYPASGPTANATSRPVAVLGASLGPQLDGPVSATSFNVTLTNLSTGAETTTTISFNPESQSLSDLSGQLDGVGNLNASLSTDGRLQLQADSGFGFDFAPRGGPEDPGGVLGALGFNAIFAGQGAADLSVSSAVRQDSRLLALGQAPGAGDGRNAGKIADLAQQGLAGLGGRNPGEAFSSILSEVGDRAAGANARLESSSTLEASLEERRSEVSGVSLEEEVVDMLRFQRSFEVAARYLRVVDEMSRELTGLVR